MKDYDRAIADFSTLIELNPKRADAFDRRALAHLGMRFSDRALKDATEALALEPNNVVFLNNRAAIYIRKGQYDNAIKDLTAALTIEPNNIRAINTRGDLHFSRKDYEKAIIDYTKAIEIDGKDAPSWNNRGLAHYHLRELDKALADYKKAFEINPQFADAHCNYAWILAACPNRNWKQAERLKYAREAEEHALKAVELDKRRTARYLGTLGVVYAAQLKFEKAIQCEEEAAKLRPGYDSAEKHKAEERIALYANRLPYYEEPESADP
jgi:tetratricopeptide (TPR) repeat protein